MCVRWSGLRERRPTGASNILQSTCILTFVAKRARALLVLVFVGVTEGGGRRFVAQRAESSDRIKRRNVANKDNGNFSTGISENWWQRGVSADLRVVPTAECSVLLSSAQRTVRSKAREQWMKSQQRWIIDAKGRLGLQLTSLCIIH